MLEEEIFHIHLSPLSSKHYDCSTTCLQAQICCTPCSLKIAPQAPSELQRELNSVFFLVRLASSCISHDPPSCHHQKPKHHLELLFLLVPISIILRFHLLTISSISPLHSIQFTCHLQAPDWYSHIHLLKNKNEITSIEIRFQHYLIKPSPT